MPAAKGWKVNRTGGGTYEFSQDAQGKYKLNSIGFQKFGKLNLPELKTEATKTTTTPKDTKTASDQTQKAFGNVETFYYHPKKGGGADEQYIDEYKIKKDKSLDTEPLVDAADAGTDWGTTTDAGKQQYWSRGQWGPQVDTKPVYIKSKGKADIKRADQIGKDMGGGRDSYTPRIPDRISSPLRPAIGTRVPDRISSPLRPAIEKTKPTNTALKAVNTTSNTLSKAFNFTFKTPAMMLIDAIAGSDPIQQGYNQRNQEAFSALGYKTRGELGSNRDPGRIAGNPAHNVFAGMNMVSMKGDVMRGARKRVATRTKTAERNKNKWSQEKKERFDKKTQEFKDQIQEAQAKKNQQDIAKGPGHYGPAGGGGNGGGNGGGRVICTELHSTGEMSTVDWVRDTRFTFKTLTKSHVKGYLFWAIPTVRHMKKYPLYRKIWKHIAQHRANDIAWRLGESKFDLLGRIYAGIGEPTCWLIGKFVSNKQYNELNLKNWRKA